ncbi:auxin-responsive protein SAUR36-like [Amborella trichopoda]|uniref:auxin-responsive protein SAUR36-like n=1 Tax=Amborella trichopoda TaxID=13333 RepID=UPI0005D39121|nr:auxin-responsive protein SAUR36-like [Amborella trichopoda]|eukprot:XP_011629051.1 auxin-responsive protein SAUR36-like [Amborella trichopoda]
MINSRRLLETAREWRVRAIRQRRRISLKSSPSDWVKVAREGHFIIYTIDGSRFGIPLAYLNRPIFRELLLMAEEEFGFTGCGPLKVPCEAFVMEYTVSLLSKNPPKQVEKALISITSCRSSLASLVPQRTILDNAVIYGY